MLWYYWYPEKWCLFFCPSRGRRNYLGLKESYQRIWSFLLSFSRKGNPVNTKGCIWPRQNNKSESLSTLSLEWSLRICSNLTVYNITSCQVQGYVSVPTRNWGRDLWATLGKKEKSWYFTRYTSQAKRVSLYKLILTPRAHADWAAAPFGDGFQLLVSTHQLWAWSGGASDFPMSARARAARGGGPFCPVLGVRKRKRRLLSDIGLHLTKQKQAFS